MNRNDKNHAKAGSTCTMNELSPGECCTVRGLQTAGAMRRRFLDIGLIENTPVTCIGRSPAGDPCAYLIRGAVIAIRGSDCSGILVERKQGDADLWD